MSRYCRTSAVGSWVMAMAMAMSSPPPTSSSRSTRTGASSCTASVAHSTLRWSSERTHPRTSGSARPMANQSGSRSHPTTWTRRGPKVSSCRAAPWTAGATLFAQSSGSRSFTREKLSPPSYRSTMSMTTFGCIDVAALSMAFTASTSVPSRASRFRSATWRRMSSRVCGPVPLVTQSRTSVRPTVTASSSCRRPARRISSFDLSSHEDSGPPFFHSMSARKESSSSASMSRCSHQRVRA